ncbi:PIR protein [Plasmodium reichenowi]|uniref:PIR protein n=1 Tax=Plasmodium reichenowi TaxID=5854 RepID=A0A2P9DCJ1_PLARE|nr:PIR protein [Plasmodium reichenowi]
MKVHYINILLFALPLNILVNTHKKPQTRPHTPTTRLLCECELYEPANYDNDPQMKSVMDNFNKQTQQRFEEYDERMKTTRQKCKDRCDKEIQKIILKDKLEKQMEQQLTTLETKITTEDIPTCVCEKSLADKTEKFCLNCGKTMGGVAPGWGLVSGILYTGWEIAATAAATQKGIEAGINAVIDTLKTLLDIKGVTDVKWKTLITAQNYTDKSLLDGVIRELAGTLCGGSEDTGGGFCLFTFNTKTLTQAINGHVPNAISKGTAEVVTVTKAEMGKVTTTGGVYSTGIIASVVAIIVIVLVMVIIYLILRYRRKKKMKKKLQYMKLLKE